MHSSRINCWTWVCVKKNRSCGTVSSKLENESVLHKKVGYFWISAVAKCKITLTFHFHIFDTILRWLFWVEVFFFKKVVAKFNSSASRHMSHWWCLFGKIKLFDTNLENRWKLILQCTFSYSTNFFWRNDIYGCNFRNVARFSCFFSQAMLAKISAI